MSSGWRRAGLPAAVVGLGVFWIATAVAQWKAGEEYWVSMPILYVATMILCCRKEMLCLLGLRRCR